MNLHTILRAACMLLLSAFTLHAGVPNLINYQGRLTDAQGSPVTGNRTMVVRVYDAPTGGNMTYEETIGTVAVANGTYSFQFGGAGDGIIGVLVGFSDYLALSVNGTEESKRTRLLAVPYALKSADAQALRAELVELGVIPTPASGNMVTVQGGTLVTSNGLNGTVVSTFQIGKYEVRWDEWQEMRTWALANGYGDFTTGNGSAADHPVRNVNWYDVVKYCNARSEREGLVPVYSVNGTVYRSGEFGSTGSSVVTRNLGATGYRLPTEAEWEWAARGRVNSQGYTYSGSNDVNAVAWHWDNASGAAVDLNIGRGTWPVGQKAANELGMHDMSGNVWEWCEDLAFGSYRRFRGGSWNNYADYASVADRDYYDPDYRRYNIGFRVSRSSGL